MASLTTCVSVAPGFDRPPAAGPDRRRISLDSIEDKDTPMSHKTSLRVWEHSQTQRAARCLMLALADFANDDGICWPGTVVLSKKINETPDYTDIIIKKCIDLGELAKHAGRGRGHPSRFAILCGLSPDEQRKLKGVLQKGYPSTPIEKRGTAKGVLSAEKRGTFSDSKQASFEAPERAETSISENDNQHDPIVGGVGGDRARAENLLLSAGIYPATVRQILAMPLDWPTVITSTQNLITAEWGPGAIADRLRLHPPAKGVPYARPEQQSARSDDAPDQRQRYAPPQKRARGSHNPTGGAELRDPGWKERLIAQAERGELP